MTVEIGSFLYFLFIFVCAALTIGLYFLLRNKTQKTQKIVLLSLLVFNFVLHFSRGFYASSIESFFSSISFKNLCATSVIAFPFIFISKSNTLKDYMIYIGILSGGATMLYPEGVLGADMTRFDNWRFYICHMLLFVVPFLMLLLKVHKLNYRNIYKMPFCVLFAYLIIMTNSIVLGEIGLLSPRGDDPLVIGYDNESLVWRADRLAGTILSWFTPAFLKTMPAGVYAGQEFYWPFLWMVVPVFIASILGALIICLPFEYKHIKEDFLKLKQKIKNKNNS